jgi:putative salt-induced outer membrane protein YdiY
MRPITRTASLLLVLASIGTASPVLAQTTGAPASQQPQKTPPEPRLGSSNSSELGLVIATGNARSTSVGLRNVYTYRWKIAELHWEAGWLRAVSRDGDRFAVETASGFDVIEPGTAIDSQRLFSKLRYQRQLTPRHDWFANFDAVRDEPSNINRQFVLAGGLGTTWRKTDRLAFRTSYGISYTDEDLVVEGGNRFAGYRLFYGLQTKLADTTDLVSELTADGSFETGDDIRTDWLNGVSVAINTRMALKSSLRVLFRNLPALEGLELRTSAGVAVGTVTVPKDKVDTNLTTSLVITF